MSETGYTIGFRQQLSMTSFAACELEITLNYFSVDTWTENGSFMQNLTSWPTPFWLVLLIEHKVFHCYATNAVYRCLVAGQLYPSCGFWAASLQLTIDASKFPTVVGQFTQQPSCTILLWRVEIFNQNHIFLWNFYDFVYFFLIFGSWQFPKVK